MEDMPKVLLMEDSQTMHEYVLALAKAHKATFEILSAYSVDECRHLLIKEGPDLLLLDFLLADGKATDVFRFMKKYSIKTPYAVFTGLTKQEIIDRSATIGAEFITNAEAIIFKNELGEWFIELVETLANLSKYNYKIVNASQRNRIDD